MVTPLMPPRPYGHQSMEPSGGEEVGSPCHGVKMIFFSGCFNRRAKFADWGSMANPLSMVDFLSPTWYIAPCSVSTAPVASKGLLVPIGGDKGDGWIVSSIPVSFTMVALYNGFNTSADFAGLLGDVHLVVRGHIVGTNGGRDGDQALTYTSASKEIIANCYYSRLKELKS